LAYSSTLNTGLHGVIFHKIDFFITTAARTSNPTEIYLIDGDFLLKPEGSSLLSNKPTIELYPEPFQISSYLHSLVSLRFILELSYDPCMQVKVKLSLHLIKHHVMKTHRV
jgi:hypothetical protein